MKYVNYDETTGQILGYYTSEIHCIVTSATYDIDGKELTPEVIDTTPLPTPYLELTEDEHSAALAVNANTIVAGKPVYVEPVLDPATILANKIADLERTRDNALQALTYDFLDGRVIATRPQDFNNFVVGIEVGESEWVDINAKVIPITTAELQEAFNAGKLAATAIWTQFKTDLKLL